MSQDHTYKPDRLLNDQALEQVLQAGATLLDVRHPQKYAAGHLHGSISLAYHPTNYAWRLEHFITVQHSLIIVSESPMERQAAAFSLMQGGYNIAGYAELDSSASLATLRQLSVVQLQNEIATGRLEQDLMVLDVREKGDWLEYHLQGAYHIPILEVPERAGELLSGRIVAVMAESNIYSTTVASYLRYMHGYEVANVPEGVPGWARSGFAIKRKEPDNKS
ncbi:MAG TPA: rhodanese-like domain-containing protein [Chloroflexia bacterium]|nr:rhodanese-like domain-containing protein [Chloroflexia bacterium]